MKTIICCDDVFEALTAGPFPTGSQQDGPIKEHLASCTDCQRLAEAFKPACNLLRESLPRCEQQSLPVYHDNERQALEKNLQVVMQGIQPTGSGRSHQADARPSPEQTVVARNWPNRFLASLCVALLLMLIVTATGPWNSKSSATTPNMQALDAMKLGNHCYRETSDSTSVHGSQKPSKQYLCCTDCHNNTPAGIRQANASSLLASCETCHN